MKKSGSGIYHTKITGKSNLLALTIAQMFLLPVPLLAASQPGSGEIEVVGRSNNGSSSYTADYSPVATGMALPLRETPQSISVITRQRMNDQGLKNLDDLMGAVTGITLQQYDNAGRITYRARGFSVSNYKTDGLATDYNSSGGDRGAIVNPVLYEQMEIIRGANGLLGGTGEPSATVNLVRKKPGKTLHSHIGLTYGRWNQKLAFADVNAPLAFDGRVRSRFIIAGEDSGSWMDRMSNKNVDLLANFGVDITDNTTLNFGAQYDRKHVNGNSWGTNVTMWYADGEPTHLPRSTNPVPNWAFTENRSSTFFASLEHYFAAGWKSKIAYSHNSFSKTLSHGIAKVNSAKRGLPNKYDGFWNQDGTGAYLNARHAETEAKEDSLELSVNGTFRLFGRSHELITGVNGSRLETTSYTFNKNNCHLADFQPWSGCMFRANSMPIENWKTWDGHYEGFTSFRTDDRDENTVTNYGGYLAGRFSLADPLIAIVGVRLSNYKTQTDSYNIDNVKSAKPAWHNNGVLTPYAGLVFDINDNYSLYASYTSVFKPQSKLDPQGDPIKPITGDSYEAGIKSELFNGRLNLSAALFTAQQRNIAEKINGVFTPKHDQAYRASAKGIRSNGLELDISGALSENWNLYFGYTLLNVNNPNSDDLDDPRHVMRLFSTYRLPGVMDGLTLGGGVRVQSYTRSEPFPGQPVDIYKNQYNTDQVSVPGFALFDLMARYQFNDNVALSINVNNLLDKVYYRQRGFYNGQIYGEPRSYRASLNISY